MTASRLICRKFLNTPWHPRCLHIILCTDCSLRHLP